MDISQQLNHEIPEFHPHVEIELPRLSSNTGNVWTVGAFRVVVGVGNIEGGIEIPSPYIVGIGLRWRFNVLRCLPNDRYFDSKCFLHIPGYEKG